MSLTDHLSIPIIKSVYFGSNSAENRKDFKKGLELFNFLDNCHYSLR